MQKIKIPTKNNQTLVCSIFYPDPSSPEKGKNPAVIFIPGWTSDESSYHQRAIALTKLGYICLAISLRGHGESSGTMEEFSRADHIEDVISVYDFLAAQKNVDKKNISAVGASYGGYLAAVLAGKKPVKHLVLRAPALYENRQLDIPTAQLVVDGEEEFFQNLHIEKDNMALSGIKKIRGDLFLIESEKDQIIPSFIVRYFKNAADKKTVITHKVMKGADHQLSKGEWKQQLIAILTSFFAKKD